MKPNPSFSHTVPGLCLERKTAGREKEERQRRQKWGRKRDDGALVYEIQAGHL